MFNNFKAKAESISAEVHHFRTNAEALDFIIKYLQNTGISDIPGCFAVWADSPFVNNVKKEDLIKKIPGLKFNINRELAKDALVGITEVDYGLADTGTLVQNQTAVDQRLASMLPRIHIAILSTGKILPDLQSVINKIKLDKNSYIAMITGPSRTADIERVLTIGVHGPERLIIVCIGD